MTYKLALKTIKNESAEQTAKRIAELYETIAELDEILTIGKYELSKGMPYPDGRNNVLWISNEVEEGMAIDLDELWNEKF